MYKAQNAQSKTTAILTLAVIFLSGYWLKCQMDVGYFPFK
jgi:hypothetical protein